MAQSFEILLAEDEKSLREALVVHLELAGYAVRAVRNGAAALDAYRARRPDLLLLDVMMPKKTGYEVCSEIRATDPQIPILFLTALSAPTDELRGLNLGADDFIQKTAGISVLLARVAAARRRVEATQTPADDVAQSFQIGACRIDAANCRLHLPDGRTEELALREVEVARALVMHPNELFSRDALLTRFWGVDFLGDENVLSVFFCRLREKLGPDGSRIETVHRKGYRLRA